MMSLFSSFDILFFSLQTPLTIFLFITLMSSSYFKGCSKAIAKKILGLCMGFLYSLKPFHLSPLSGVIFSALLLLFLLMNFFSVAPYNFAASSQPSLVFFLGLSVWMGFNIFYHIWNTMGALSHLIPEGSPVYLVPLLFVIEAVSMIIRPITLSVRMVANILAGHLLMILLSSLVLSHSLMLPLYVLLNLVEFFVAIIQSYIFMTMLGLYYSDVD